MSQRLQVPGGKKKKSIETRFCSAALHGLASRDPNDEKETTLSPFHMSQNRVKTSSISWSLMVNHSTKNIQCKSDFKICQVKAGFNSSAVMASEFQISAWRYQVTFKNFRPETPGKQHILKWYAFIIKYSELKIWLFLPP